MSLRMSCGVPVASSTDRVVCASPLCLAMSAVPFPESVQPVLIGGEIVDPRLRGGMQIAVTSEQRRAADEHAVAAIGMQLAEAGLAGLELQVALAGAELHASEPIAELGQVRESGFRHRRERDAPALQEGRAVDFFAGGGPHVRADRLRERVPRVGGSAHQNTVPAITLRTTTTPNTAFEKVPVVWMRR